jgi:hypothetical protein
MDDSPLTSFRAQYPAYSDMSDAELTDALHKTYYSDIDRKEFNNKIGFKGMAQGADGVTFLDSIKAGIENMGSAGIALKAGVSDLLGNEQAELSAIEQYNRNQEKVGKLLEGATDWRDIVDSDSIGQGFGRTLDFVKEQFGLNSPQMATILAGGMGGAVAAPYLPHPIATAVSKVGGFSVGAAMTALPMFTGFNVGRQIDEGLDPDIVKAGAMAVPQAAAEAMLAGVFKTTGLTTVGTKLLGETSKSMVKRTGQKLGELLAIGVPSEVIQQGFERAAADLEVNPWESEEAFTEYLDTAIATIGALTPMGSIALIPGSDTKHNFKRDDKTVQNIIKEEVLAAPAPAQNAIKTPEEAVKALNSLGINPDMFTPEAQVKAANLYIDKIDNNRKAFIGNLVPQTGDMKSFLNSTSTLNPLKQMVNSKTPVDSATIETLGRTDKGIRELADVIPSMKAPTKPYTPTIDTEASTGTLLEQGRVVAQIRNNSLTTPDLPNNPTISDVPGQIVADFESFKKPLTDLYRLPKEELVKVAKETYAIPEEGLKDKAGKELPKRDIVAKIAQQRAENMERFQPKPMSQPVTPTSAPLNRITSDGLDAVVNKVAPLKPPPEVVKKFKPVADQLNRVSKDTQVKINLDTDLTVDSETKNFTKPLKAAQAINYLFTVSNFNNVSGYPNMDTHLQETWEYMFDKLPKETKQSLFDEVPALKKSIDESDGTGFHNIEFWSRNEIGQREAMSYAFSRYAQAARTRKTDDLKLPPNLKGQFSKLVRTLEKSKDATRGLGLNTFEEVFPVVSETGVTSRQAVFDTVDRLRQERLKKLADNIQFEHWDDLDRISIRDNMQKAIKDGIKGEAMSKTGLYTRSMFSSIIHAASKHPVMSIAFNLRRDQETLQSNYLTQFSENGEQFFREPSKEVRVKAAEILDHLRLTDQSITRDNTGAILFERDGKMVKISHPDMIKAVDSLHKWAQGILDVAEGDTRASINELIPGTMTLSLSEIVKTVNQVEVDASLEVSDIEFIRDQIEVLENIKRMRGKPFIPHMRFGSFGFTVHSKVNIGPDGKVKPNAKPVYHSQVEKGNYKNRWHKEQYMAVQESLKKYRNNPDFVIFEDTKMNPFEMTYSNMYDKVARDNITLEMLSGLLGSDKTEEYFVDIKQKLDNKTKYRGFKKRFGEADNIPGYSTDWDRVINSYNMGAAHFFAKSRYAPLLQEYKDKVQSELSDEHGWLKKKVSEYIDYTNSPHDSFQAIRTINFLWTMGGNFSSALLQVMTLPTTTLGSMSQYNPNLFQNAKLFSKYFTVAMNEFADNEVSVFEDGVYIFRLDNPKLLSTLKNKHKFSEDEVQFVKRLFNDGRTGAAFLEEQTGKKNFETRTTSGKFKDKFSKYSHFLGTPISAMEQATRFASAMAHYHMFKTNPEAVKRALRVLENDHRFQQQRKLSKKSLIEDLAYFGLDEAHAVFGKVGRGGLLRGGLGAFVFPFMTYPQNVLEFMIRMAGRGPEGKQALIVTAGAIFMFSGLIGLPGGELAKELLEAAYKITAGEEIDIEYLIREKLTDVTGDPRPGMFVTQGLFRALLNMDVSRRIGVPIPGQELILAMMGVRGDMSDLLGVLGSMLSQGVAAWRAYATDESGLKVASMMTPTAVSNVLKAASYYDEGVRTARGTQLVSKEDIRNNPVEIFMRAMGITTGRIASAREEQYWRQTENKAIRPKMDSFRTRGKNYATKQMEALKEGRPEEAEKWREKYQDLIKEVGEYLNRKKQPYDMASFHRSVFDAVDQRAAAGVRLEDLNKGLRNKKEALTKASGRELYDE